MNLVWSEGTLGASKGLSELTDGFNKVYGLSTKVNFTPGASQDQMAARTAQEQQSGRAATTDLLSIPASQMRVAALTPVNWSAWASNVKNPEMVSPDGTAVAVETWIEGATYNSSKLKGDAIPKTMEDLLKPQYKGRVATTPYAAGFDVLASNEVWGAQRTLDFAGKLSPQLGGLIRCGDPSRIADGEFDVFVFDCNQAFAHQAKQAGQPVDFAVLNDAAILLYQYLAVPKNSAHPSTAKLWVNYLLSPDAQSILRKDDYTDSHFVAGSVAAQDIATAQAAGAKFITDDAAFVQRNDAAEIYKTNSQVAAIFQKK
ncbi:MAG: ABC transporter substrate-binding protein [Chloroflexi bacterium]|nr:ABC transporter substrate-binding protein [Chloroflexota bacterium]